MSALKRIYLLILCIASLQTFAQDMAHVPVDTAVYCQQSSNSSSQSYVHYMKADRPDSVQNLLDYWSAVCGDLEPLQRARILYHLKYRTYKDTVLTRNITGHMQVYSYQMAKKGHKAPGDTVLFSQMPFNAYTKQLAKELVSQYPKGSVEYALADFYGNENTHIYGQIQDSVFVHEDTLTAAYTRAVNAYLSPIWIHTSIAAGTWIPNGGLKPLGTHPELALQGGFKLPKLQYDLTICFRFGNAAEPYYAQRRSNGNQKELTNHYFGGSMGLNVGFDIFDQDRSNLQLIGALAYETFDVFAEEPDRDNSTAVKTFSVGAGIGYHYALNYSSYIGIRARYIIADYTLNKVIDFTGNAIGIQLVYGGFNNRSRGYGFKALRYKKYR